jgi:flagellar biosynthesis/type III secretory pathway ATPase
MAAYRDKEDLIAIGAYQPGGDPTVDAAIALRPDLDAFLRQRPEERSDLAEADQRLLALAAAAAEAPADPPEGSGDPEFG